MTTAVNKSAFKKVKPYPIPALLSIEGAAPLKGKILKLVGKGFIADVSPNFLNVGDIYKCDFEIPVMHYVVTTMIKVIKTYDRSKSKAEIERLVECHFVQLNEEQSGRVLTFMRLAKQPSE
jgi:hypothetical protein